MTLPGRLQRLRRPGKVVGILALLYLLWVVGTKGGPYQDQLVVLAAIYVILATSLNLLLGYSGLLSLGHQAFFGIGAYASALLTVDVGLPMPLAVACSVAIVAFCGWAVGKITLRLRAAYFVIATFAFAEICRQFALNWVSLTRGPAGLPGVPPVGVGNVALVEPEEVYPLVLIVAAVCVFVVARIARSSLGYSLRAMAENENLAAAVGIDTARHANLAFVLGAGMASVAGALYVHSVGFVSPEVFNFSIMINMLLMVLGGGMGTVLGPVLGAVIFTELPELLRFSDEWRLVIYGVILVLLVRFLPRGIWGSFVTYRRQRRYDSAVTQQPATDASGMPAACRHDEQPDEMRPVP